MFDSLPRGSEQKKSLADGMNIGSIGLGLMFMGLSVGAGLYILGVNDAAQWIAGLSVAMFGALSAFGFGTGIAGYWNYDS